MRRPRPSGSRGWTRVGTDHCLVNPGGYWQQLEFLGADRAKGVRRCNDFLTEQLADQSEPAARGRGRRLRRPRRRRRRARARAVARRACVLPLHREGPSAVERLAGPSGMGPGLGRGDAPRHGRGGPHRQHRARLHRLGRHRMAAARAVRGSAGLMRLANTQRAHAAQNLLSALLYGGVFARHPTLTVLLEEMRVNWIPPFVDTLSRQSLPSPILGDWPYDVAGGDMLRRNVRVDAAARARRHRRARVPRRAPRDVRVLVGLPAPRGERRADRPVPARARRRSTRSSARWFLGDNSRRLLRPDGLIRCDEREEPVRSHGQGGDRHRLDERDRPRHGRRVSRKPARRSW